MTRIVTTSYRYKRPPRKRNAVAMEVPVIATARTPGNRKHAAAVANLALDVEAAADQPRQPFGAENYARCSDHQLTWGELPRNV